MLEYSREYNITSENAMHNKEVSGIPTSKKLSDLFSYTLLHSKWKTSYYKQR
jgi:hypothetical protein